MWGLRKGREETDRLTEMAKDTDKEMRKHRNDEFSCTVVRFVQNHAESRLSI